jgi:RNA polymerase sigma-54 factor
MAAIKMSQSLKQTQSLMMTPQLQQAIKLLTLTHLEMTNLIAQEMVENPMLEEMDNEISKEEADEVTREDMETREATADNFSGPELIDGARETFDWENYAESFNSNSSAPSVKENYSSEDMPNYENMVTKSMSLPDHLEWQLKMENVSDEEMDFATLVIHSINDEGYLSANIDELISQTKLDRQEALDVISMIQHFDPVGCGSQNLQECLLVQAQNLPERSPVLEMLISKHLNDLEKKDYAKITKDSGISREVIKDTEQILMSLHPKPGRLVGGDETQYVVPDIFIEEISGEFVVQVNDEGVPKLKISKMYHALVQKAAASPDQEFLQDKLRSATWLIKSIENRQKTITKVAIAIVKNQQEFFKKGPAHLKPMILKDVANEIGMHESTVSRVTTNKFMHTPLGTFELKYFFNVGIGGKNGGIDIAGEPLKLKIKELINAEDSKRPISDQKISELLSTKDIVVARRTVAKYREMMGIATSAQRKKK